MGIKCGIVGLPNIGKSTLFNALTKTQTAEAANYPFCTIEPNIGKVTVPDDRITKIAEIAGSIKIVPLRIEFVDIAGLVKGASKGEGLGNKFLSHIRSTDLIAHMVRCFENGDITHTEGKIDPVRDIELIETELIISDLERAEKRKESLQKELRRGNAEAFIQTEVLAFILPFLQEGNSARDGFRPQNCNNNNSRKSSDYGSVAPSLSKSLQQHLQSQQEILMKINTDVEYQKQLKMLELITIKPTVYICNVADEDLPNGNKYSDMVQEFAKLRGASSCIISAKIEEEIANLTDETEQKEFIQMLNIDETGLSQLIRISYNLLGLKTFFTAGEKEARAWLCKQDATAPNAAGVIHSDFERGFICAETISYKDYIELGGEKPAKEAGKLRQEGKSYKVQDADIFNFKFNV